MLRPQAQDLSGGELQRFACAVVCVQKAEVVMFDEPSSYLDVKQRLNAARAIRSMRGEKKWVRNYVLRDAPVATPEGCLPATCRFYAPDNAATCDIASRLTA